MRATPRTIALRYASAILAIGAATGIRGVLSPLLGDSVPYAFFFVAVIFTALYGGLGPAFLAAVLGALSATYFFLPPQGVVVPAPVAGWTALWVFLCLGFALALLSQSMRAAQDRAEASALAASAENAALRRSEERFARFMQHLPGLAWIKDHEGRYVYANDAAVRAFQISRERLYGKTDHEVFRPATAAQFRANDQRALTSGKGIQVIEELQHEDGHVHYSLVAKFPIPNPDGSGTLVGGMAIDVSEQRRTEEALRDADRRKDEFLAMLAHELRNPLAPIRNAAQVVKLVGPAEPNLQRATEMIERQVGQLARLVDDLLDVSRLTRGKITLQKEPLDLATVVARAVETSRPALDTRRLELAVELPPQPVWVDGDVTRLSQALANLLNNAAKYTPPGGHVWLRLGYEEGRAVVRVRDTGIGIPAELLPRVFDLFVQGDRTLSRSEGGLGIGLTVVKSLVEMHGGSVEAHSAGVNQGSEFVVRLPALASPPPAPLEQPGAPLSRAAAVSRRVLVVDDNIDAAQSLALFLQAQQHDVRAVHNGPAALEAAREFRPQVIFLDIGLPQMDGYEVARRLRAQGDLDNALLVAVTGYGQDEDRRRSAEAGFDGHLVKPVDLEELQRFLRR